MLADDRAVRDADARGVAAYAAGTLESTPQGAGGITHRNMSPEGVERIQQKLAQGRYAHYVD
ncbi:hypothetical protein ACNOYE_03525 [Nannocystaceae bacterium ST9]